MNTHSKHALTLCLLLLCLCNPLHADASPNYLSKFFAYLYWSQHLPTTPDERFLDFIAVESPLTNKLREKWLIQLGSKKDWITFNQYYRATNNTSLKCYRQLALYHQGEQSKADLASKAIWLSADSLPSACDPLFERLLKSNVIDDYLLLKRIQLTLEKGNEPLAKYLLKQFNPPKIHEVTILSRIASHPELIEKLSFNKLHSDFYLYGLKRMLKRNVDKSIAYYKQPKTKLMLTTSQQQSFLVSLTLYKLIRNQEDANEWFAKINPTFYTEPLLDWKFRYSLKHHRWQDVKKTIGLMKDKDNPCYQYWLARAHEKLGEQETANKMYQSIASMRNYYGFLASLKLKKSFSFENEAIIRDAEILRPYKPITDQIEQLYLSRQKYEASKLLNDFISELPKREKSALAYWIATTLHWHGKAIYLGNQDELNDQLILRFPLAHRRTVKQYAQQYKIPQEFIYAIIRQESLFQEDIVSSAGANGLMQLMPATAHLVALREKIPYTNQKQLFSSEKNIHIGTAYLQQLSKKYQNHPVLMAAAYNAGPRQVNYWLKNHSPKEMDVWIETLPWTETRNYLKNVIAFYAVYQYRMKQPLNINAFMRSIDSHRL